jgi:hypothetical protein
MYVFTPKTALARHYIDILSIGKDSLDAKKLLNYKAPIHTLKVGCLESHLTSHFVHNGTVLCHMCHVSHICNT